MMNLKLLPLLILFMLFFKLDINAQEADVKPEKESAEIILNRAYEQAAKENKNVMAIFSASWCKWCQRMMKTMKNPACEDFFTDNYVIVKLDVKESSRRKHMETPGAEALLERYSADKQGVPYFMIFNKDGKLLNRSINKEGVNIGCPAVEKDIVVFRKILKETSNLTDKELDAIGNEFLLKKTVSE